MYYAKSASTASPLWIKSKTIKGFFYSFDRHSEIVIVKGHPDKAKKGRHYVIRTYSVVPVDDRKESSLKINKLLAQKWS